MNINEVDNFRNKFFEKLIKEETEKERAIKIAQSQCFHTYNIMGLVGDNGYQQRTCSKCGYTALKNVRVWEGTKNGNCNIQ